MSKFQDLDLQYAMDPVAWVRKVLHFDPDEAQQKVLCPYTKRMLLNCTRQWGKSTTTAAKAVHRAVHFRDTLVVAMSPSGRQTGELLRKMSAFLKICQQEVHGDGDNEQSLLLNNGSRIVGLPGGEATIRGFSSVSLLIIDEAARVPDASYRAARPMLAVGGGSLLMMSTPFGKRGFFYDEWIGANAWARIMVPASRCTRIPREFLEEERKSLGEQWFRQEYCCEFLDTDSQLFGRDMLDKALDDQLEPYF